MHTLVPIVALGAGVLVLIAFCGIVSSVRIAPGVGSSRPISRACRVGPTQSQRGHVHKKDSTDHPAHRE